MKIVRHKYTAPSPTDHAAFPSELLAIRADLLHIRSTRLQRRLSAPILSVAWWLDNALHRLALRLRDDAEDRLGPDVAAATGVVCSDDCAATAGA